MCSEQHILLMTRKQGDGVWPAFRRLCFIFNRDNPEKELGISAGLWKVKKEPRAVQIYFTGHELDGDQKEKLYQQSLDQVSTLF